LERLFPLLDEFYRSSCGTRIKLLTEVYGGAWDALVSDRADLVIGAPSDGPTGGGYSTHPLGLVQWAFMVAPTHPLASAAEPLLPEAIVQYRSIAAADSSRNMPPRTTGLLNGQDVLTVPDMRSKIQFQCAGLGVGYLPLHLTRADVQSGRLVIRQVVETRLGTPLYIAWRTAQQGKALAWFLERLEQPALREILLA
jgi:DNA-binding transcriptional LysR family regulator